MEKKKKNQLWAKEDKIHDSKDRKREREELVEQDVKSRTLQKTETYILLLRNNNKRGRKPSRIYKGNNMKM